ncbi:hypothetical protein H8R29_19325 [Priestia megaterium]|jgi:hypothetical protein|uniref:Putative membrane protein n=1 Tax=Priestia megaterium (strain ATCC 14581 / DSM 32 / CCUG 1817 / JCM 2506 / NBRC 15308 / NCIMB 9376 / NCTC 10342 / NRRL B-14308 / VKM B-512 / Ford 19) TaxID=1348623 RepID=A0A0B6AIF1_PRIM2|nr:MULTISPECIES: hypothetical protein [Priestia]AJI24665.1 putative membrane protein [Priestia megaterium NBRC 15308 = ATCC 14581]KFN06186.1 putative membrane protein [Priestia megaterium]KGJ81267.1 hypothetical protein BMT_18760 [Priestia megaterium NBRC 15308 = ATCC 14581]MBU8753560.1 hypothetical protein [Priestia megaterium]MCR8927577.1 hypothetical protein [Priestia megaterium]
MSPDNTFKDFLGGKIDLFSRGSFQMFTFLILFSPLFTHMFKENVLLYVMFALLITINNLGVEFFSIKKRGPEPKKYILLFLSISLPVDILLLCLFYILG